MHGTKQSPLITWFLFARRRPVWSYARRVATDCINILRISYSVKAAVRCRSLVRPRLKGALRQMEQPLHEIHAKNSSQFIEKIRTVLLNVPKVRFTACPVPQI